MAVCPALEAFSAERPLPAVPLCTRLFTVALLPVCCLETQQLKTHVLALQRQIKECDSKLKKYRELLETQPDVAVVGTWISEVERERQKLQRQLNVRPKNQSMTTAEIRDLVEQLRDIVGVLANASPADRRAVYDELGVSLTYHPETKSIEVGAGAPHVLRVGVGGGT